MSDGSAARAERGFEPPAQAVDAAAPRRDPLSAILSLGQRQVRTGAILGLAGALLLHAGGAGQAAASLIDVSSFVSQVRSAVRERLRAEYDIEFTEPEPPPPEPEPEPVAEPEPAPELKAPPDKAPAPEETVPAPAAAQAANVLAAEADPDAPVDLTGNTFVVGSGETYAGGITASSGTGKTAVRDVRAAPTGVGKVAATTPVGTVAAGPDRSRQAKSIGGWQDSCPFPSEANAEGVNQAHVLLSVTLTPDGRVKSANVVQDPGTGFGKQARSCALRDGRFEPALDSAGNPITKTVTVRMKFRR